MLDDCNIWFRHTDFGFCRHPEKVQYHTEEVTLIPTFGLHYMRAMREGSLVKGTNRLGQYGSRLKPKGLRFWVESKYYGASVARLRWRHRNGISSVSPGVKISMYLTEYPS